MSADEAKDYGLIDQVIVPTAGSGKIITPSAPEAAVAGGK